MSSSVARSRPQFRNISIAHISRYRLPWAGKVSILHRVSGALLFFCIPLVILPLFESSVTSAAGFARLSMFFSHPLAKLLVLVLVWGYLHHFCAGVRFLILDLHVGVSKERSSQSAVAVLIISLLLTAAFGLKIFGVW